MPQYLHVLKNVEGFYSFFQSLSHLYLSNCMAPSKQISGQLDVSVIFRKY
jgi:hypothetical protein